MTDTLGDALPREMARVRDEMIPRYDALRDLPGVNVTFVLMLMRKALDDAAKAMAEGDIAKMIVAYEDLKGFNA